MLAMQAVTLSSAHAASAAEGPQSGGAIVYAIAKYPPCLDRVQSNPEPSVFQQVTDNLLDQDYTYATRSNQILVPGTPLSFRAAVTVKF